METLWKCKGRIKIKKECAKKVKSVESVKNWLIKLNFD